MGNLWSAQHQQVERKHTKASKGKKEELELIGFIERESETPEGPGVLF